MQIDRLFGIIYLLLEKPCVTAGELGERFEVSTRTIYRDIETLSGAGIPVYASKGRTGGIRLLPGYTLDRSLFTEGEQRQLLATVQSLDAVGLPGTNQVLDKLSGLFRREELSWIKVDFSDWSNTRQELLETLRNAIVEKWVLEFDYYGANGVCSHRVVEPLQLWFKSSAWYIRAYCRTKGDYRLFRMTRIQRAQKRDERFERRLPPAEEEMGESPNAGRAPEFVTYKLWIDASQAYRVYDEFDERAVSKLPDGNFIVDGSFPEGDWVDGFFMSFGPNLKVMEPDFLRERIKEKFTRALENYL